MTLKFTDKKDKSREGSGINRENDGDKEDDSSKGSRINRENNSKDKDN